MKIGWSVQRHISVNGIVELLQMSSTGSRVRDLKDHYYAKMAHSAVERLEKEQIFSRNVSFIELYLETMDSEGRLKEEYRSQVSSPSAAKDFLFRRSYENLLAFKILIDSTNGQPPSDMRTLRSRLSKALLSKAKELDRAGYEKKVESLRTNYGDERVWIYPQPSLDRLLEIAELGARVTRENGRIRIEWGGAKAEGYNVEMMPIGEFIDMVHSTFNEMVSGNLGNIISLDPFREAVINKTQIDKNQFDMLFDALCQEDDSITVFSGRMGNEEGLTLSNGKQIYRFTIT